MVGIILKMIYETCSLKSLASVIYSIYSTVVLKYRLFGTKITINQKLCVKHDVYEVYKFTYIPKT